MRTRIAWIVVALAAGPVPASSQQAQEAPGARTRCRSIEVTSSPESEQTRKLPRFSASQILDLGFIINLSKRRASAPPETLKLTLVTPNGHVYQELTVPVAWDPSSERLASVSAPPFPVGGTAIVSNSLYGRWKVVTKVEGGPSRSGCRVRFRLQP